MSEEDRYEELALRKMESRGLPGVDPAQIGPSAWASAGLGLGLGAMRGAAMTGQGVAAAGAVVPIAVDNLVGQVTGKPSTALQDRYFENVVDPVRDSVKYWRPDAGEVGTAGQVMGGLAEMIAPLAAGGGNPTLFMQAYGANTALDLSDEGVDAGTAVALGTVNAAAVGIGFKLPFYGKTLTSRGLSGAGGNLALGVANRAVAHDVLAGEGYTEQAAAYDPLDTTTATIETLAGLGFGALAHKMATPGTVDAALTGRNAANFQDNAHPGTPADPRSSIAAQKALSESIGQVLRGEQVNIASTIRDADFLDPSYRAPVVRVDDALATVDGAPRAARAWVPKDDAATAIKAGADELGIDAVDLATVISYETGGTFNPDQVGPTTHRGQHRGLIQFGESERAKYGVRAGMTVAEQMRSVVAYLRDRGVKPGMGMLDVYSTVNAGSPGRYKASDTAAGGAPGTVRDKVASKQMAQHRAKAQAMFDGGAPYTRDAPARMPHEDDKAYAKRAIDTLPPPDPAMLPDEPASYFKVTPDTQLVDLGALYSSKTPADNAQGGTNGLNRMAAAREGVLGKRAPIDVMRNSDGTFVVTDGNGTLTAAQGLGWKQLPVRVVGERSIAEQLPDVPEATRAKLGEKYVEARAVKPKFDQAVDDIAGEVGATVHRGPIKRVAKAATKIVNDYAGDATKIKDLVRSTIEVDTYAQAQGALQAAIRRFGNHDGLRNSLAPGSEALSVDGYRDIKLNTDVNGHTVELQINFPEMLAAKKLAHPLYDKAAVITQRARADGNRPLTAAEYKEWSRLQAEQSAIYAAAWDSIISRNAASETSVPLRTNDSVGNGRGSSESQAVDTALNSETGTPSTSANLVPGGNVTEAVIGGSPSTEIIAKTDLSSADFPLQGADSKVITERGQTLPVRWAVVEADTLVTSHDDALAPNPDFPAELQPRDRARAASEAQVAKIANAINPELLAESPKASDGAPIIGADKVVESGNARTIALRRAYKRGKAEAYRTWLASNAERFGLDTGALGGIREPVLVRVATAAHDRADFARQANESSVAAMSLTEQAGADAARLPDLATMVPNEDGTINVTASGRFIAKFMESMPPSEHGTMQTSDGQLSQQGQARIRNAVFAKAYGDADLVAMLTESSDGNVKNILSGMMKAAAQIAKQRGEIAAGQRQPLDFAPDLVAAVRKFSQLRSEGETVQGFLGTPDFFGANADAGMNNWLTALDENSKAPRRIADLITRQVGAIEAMGNPGQADILAGAGPTGNKGDVLREAVEGIRRDYQVKPSGSLFNAAGRPSLEAVAPVLRAVDDLVIESPDLPMIQGYDADGAPRYQTIADAKADIEAEHAQAVKDAEAYEAAVNCHLRRGMQRAA